MIRYDYYMRMDAESVFREKITFDFFDRMVSEPTEWSDDDEVF